MLLIHVRFDAEECCLTAEIATGQALRRSGHRGVVLARIARRLSEASSCHGSAPRVFVLTLWTCKCSPFLIQGDHLADIDAILDDGVADLKVASRQPCGQSECRFFSSTLTVESGSMIQPVALPFRAAFYDDDANAVTAQCTTK